MALIGAQKGGGQDQAHQAEHSQVTGGVILDQDYYRLNFRHLIGFVRSSYSDLLSQAELEYARILLDLDPDALRLYIRLLCRSKSLFRLDKLNYSEIGDLSPVVKTLACENLLELDPELGVQEALSLLTKPEVLSAIDQPLLRSCEWPSDIRTLKQLKRDQLDELVCSVMLDSRNLTTGLCILRTRSEEIFDVYKLCFFGNLYQDMTDYVLRDLGLTRFESYRIDRKTRAFANRSQIDAHLRYYQCASILESAEELNVQALLDLCESLPPKIDTALSRRVDRLRTRVARDLERAHQFDLALRLYRQCEKPPARERQARILAQMGEVDQALSLCSEILDCPVDAEEKQVIGSFAVRLGKKHGKAVDQIAVYKPPVQTIELEHDGRSVEIQSVDYFAAGGRCFYTENTLFTAVFGLAFWDIIFAPIAGAFFNPFQNAPVDFYENEFLDKRALMISDRLELLLSASQLPTLVNSNFERCNGLQNAMINWRNLDEKLLTVALARIPAVDWNAIFKRLLEDLRLNRTGLPDIIFFPESGGYELIEIKGPGDSLQKNQLRWLDYFAQVGIAHKVCHVRWVASV